VPLRLVRSFYEKSKKMKGERVGGKRNLISWGASSSRPVREAADRLRVRKAEPLERGNQPPGHYGRRSIDGAGGGVV